MNRQYVEQEKRYRKLVRETVPVVYAAFAIAIHREFGFGYKRILRVLALTQKYWRDHADGYMDIIKVCSEELGIDMISETTAKSTGADGERI